jgi:hypothetical protein
MPKSEVDAIKYGPRPKRGIKESGTKSIVAMKWNETFEDALD